MGEDNMIVDYMAAARADLRIVDRLAPNAHEVAEGVCFHCQQMDEKVLKAVWCSNGMLPGSDRDLDDLIGVVTERGWLKASKDDLNAISFLIPYSTAFRHIAMSDFEHDEALQTLSCAKKALDMIGRNGYETLELKTGAHYVRDEAQASTNEPLAEQQAMANRAVQNGSDDNTLDALRDSDHAL